MGRPDVIMGKHRGRILYTLSQHGTDRETESGGGETQTEKWNGV